VPTRCFACLAEWVGVGAGLFESIEVIGIGVDWDRWLAQKAR